MEVHHHPHVEKKNFREYLLEGLMIFLAVTMGFFAESLREYFGDREKETHYMLSLAEDLKKDTQAIRYSINRLETDLEAGHKLIVLAATNKLSGMSDPEILRITRQTGLSADIVFNDRTAFQLKSSGSIRLIRHKAIVDSILQYWNNQIATMQIHERFESTRTEQHKIAHKTFSWYKNYYFPRAMGADSSLVAAMPVKAILHPENMDEFLNSCGNLFNLGHYQYLPILRKQQDLATELIRLIQQEYHEEKN
jgi:hypothetical protein